MWIQLHSQGNPKITHTSKAWGWKASLRALQENILYREVSKKTHPSGPSKLRNGEQGKYEESKQCKNKIANNDFIDISECLNSE